jgi:hypothetical protein
VPNYQRPHLANLAAKHFPDSSQHQFVGFIITLAQSLQLSISSTLLLSFCFYSVFPFFVDEAKLVLILCPSVTVSTTMDMDSMCVPPNEMTHLLPYFE